MEDDLEKRIADLEGGSAASEGRHFRPDPEPAINPQNPFEDPDELKRGVVGWIREHWTVIDIGVLALVGASLTKLEKIFPALDEPAPDWMGPLFLIGVFGSVVVYFVVRFIKSRR